jgi:voltage-gated potassium channel
MPLPHRRTCVESRLLRRLQARTPRGLLYSLVLALTILCLGGLGFWLLDPQVHSLSDGLWLAFTTAATVGYGDTVPSTSLSRAFAVVVVLLGLAVLSLVTASVAALFVKTEERAIERELLQELEHMRAQVTALQVAVTDLSRQLKLPRD